MATTQSTVPPFDRPPRLNKSPITANGITNQLNQPKSGINASSIPKIDNTPKILPNVFMYFVFLCHKTITPPRQTASLAIRECSNSLFILNLCVTLCLLWESGCLNRERQGRKGKFYNRIYFLNYESTTVCLQYPES